MKGQFQSSLFGYSKQSVHIYLSQMNEDFANKLLAKEKEGRDAVQALNEELERLRKENEQLRAERGEVAGALIDAKAFAADLMKQADEKDREQRAKNEEIRRAERLRLQDLAGHIDALRDGLHSALSSMDEELERYNLLLEAIDVKDTELPLPQQEDAGQEPTCE